MIRKRQFASILFIAAIFYQFSIMPADSATRTALVIGNGNYKMSPLANPVNDATDMAAALKKQGFDVIIKTNANKREMLKALNEFKQQLRGSEAGLFYFAGHGMQIRGSNYLIPVDVQINSELDVEYESLNASRVLANMEEAGTKVNIVILDACRDNPFKRSFRSANRGLSIMQASRGSFVAYATSPGSVAADGTGRNGVYTHHILRQIVRPNVTVEEVFRDVRKRVYEETGGAQLPWDSSSLMGSFYLASSGTVIETPSTISSIKGRLTVYTNVNDADVIVDGKFIGSAPLKELELTAGSHRVQVKKQGYDTYRTTVEVTAGRTASLEAHLTERGPKTGRLYVTTEPTGARIRILNIDDKFRQGIELEPGSYHVEVSTTGYEIQTRWVNLSAGEDKRVTFNLTATSAPKQEMMGKSRISNNLGMEFVYIEPGIFMMGQTDEGRRALVQKFGEDGYNKHYSEETRHQVTLTRGYYLQTTEVTQGQWIAMMGKNPSKFKRCGEDCPVEQVSWEDIQMFIRKLNDAQGSQQYRLPTEAEWEYACRAGSQSPFAHGNCLPTDKVNYNGKWPMPGCSKGKYRKKTVPVGSFPGNAWGLHAMHGNVSEWCEDWHGGYHSDSITDPKGPSSGSHRVRRGGSWGETAWNCRSAFRHSHRPGRRSKYLGFRLARNP